MGSKSCFKKDYFTKGLALGVVTAALLAFIPGVSLTAFGNFLVSETVGIINGHLGDDVTLFVGAQKETVARAYYVGTKGFTTKTKHTINMYMVINLTVQQRENCTKVMGVLGSTMIGPILEERMLLINNIVI